MLPRLLLVACLLSSVHLAASVAAQPPGHPPMPPSVVVPPPPFVPDASAPLPDESWLITWATDLERRVTAIRAEAQAILARNVTLGRKSKLPLWVTDAQARITTLAVMGGGDQPWWRRPRPKPTIPTTPPIPPTPSTPSTLPLLSLTTGVTYAGAFRFPGTDSTGFNFSDEIVDFTINPTTPTIFATNYRRTAEITVPALVNSGTLNDLNTASYVQSFVDLTEGNYTLFGDYRYGGMLLYNGRLCFSMYIYYDANNTARKSHGCHSPTLATPSFTGWSSVWNVTQQGFVAGYMSLVPAALQALLGGPALTGECCLSIITRTSFGPSAFAFDPDAITGGAAVPAQPLLYYPSTNPTLGPWEGANANYGSATQITGMLLVPGTRTLLFFGRNGLGPFCYGTGTPVNPPPPGVCYDPVYSSQSQHSFPYVPQIWAYDVNDLIAVKNGNMQPWEPRPYAVYNPTVPYVNGAAEWGGLAYHEPTKTLYVTQRYVDTNGNKPLMHGFVLSGF